VSRLVLVALAAQVLASRASGESHEVELGVENFLYATQASPLNRDNVLGLDPSEDLLRATLHVKESVGDARAVLSGFVERTFGAGNGTSWTAREAYAQYRFGSGLAVRLGKQRISWGSGFAWNPTNRVDPPKNPLNPSLEQEGALAARMDFIPNSWAGIILVAAQGETSFHDLPFSIPATKRRTAAVRARFLLRDTDLALVLSGGTNQRRLTGFDLGRGLGGASVHLEAAFYKGAEIPPSRDGETFFRVAAGVLHTHGNTTVSGEYFFNGEGYSSRAFESYLQGLANSFTAAEDPRLPPVQRGASLSAYLLGAGIPYSGGLGLRRHYLHVAWSRGEIRGKWTASARAVLGLGDGGLALTPGLAYAPRGDVVLNLDGVFLVGPQTSEYRLAPIRRAVQARLKILF
jgi:hypothetical protein